MDEQLQPEYKAAYDAFAGNDESQRRWLTISDKVIQARLARLATTETDTQEHRTVAHARAEFLALAKLWAATPLDMDLHERMQDAKEELWAIAYKEKEQACERNT